MVVRVVILIADGFTDSGLSVLLDVLRTANVLAKEERFSITIASASTNKDGRVRAASGVEIASTKRLRAASNADILIVPGLWIESPEEVDEVLTRRDVASLVRAIAAAAKRGAVVAASCTGVFFLAEAGLLDRVNATTTWWLAPHLQQRYPTAKVDRQASLIATRKVLTAGAVLGVADLALHLVARFVGPKVAHRASQLLLLDRHPSQAPYMAIHQLASNDHLVRRAESWVRDHLAEGFDIARLAKSIGTSPRTLARKLQSAVGQSPLGFVQRVRVETAIFLLRTTNLSIPEITAKVGYADESTLRRLIRRETKASPHELRAS